MAGKKEPKLDLGGSGKLTSKKFAPGKDARYKSDLISTVLNGPLKGQAAKDEKERLQGFGYSPQYIKEDAALLVSSERAEAILAEFEWTSHLDRKRELMAEKERKSQAAVDAKLAREAEAAEKKAAKEAKAAEDTEAADAA